MHRARGDVSARADSRDLAAFLGGIVGGRGDLDSVLAEQGADRVDPESVPAFVDAIDDHRSRRSTSAAAKNADAVLGISLALRNSEFSRRSAFSSASWSSHARVSCTLAEGSSFSTQFRIVAGLISSSAPTCVRAVWSRRAQTDGLDTLELPAPCHQSPLAAPHSPQRTRKVPHCTIRDSTSSRPIAG